MSFPGSVENHLQRAARVRRFPVERTRFCYKKTKQKLTINLFLTVFSRLRSLSGPSTGAVATGGGGGADVVFSAFGFFVLFLVFVAVWPLLF